MFLRKKKTNRVRRAPPAPKRQARLPEFALLLRPLKVAVLAALLLGGGALGYRLLDTEVTTMTVTAPYQRVTEVQIEDQVRRGLDGGILSSDLGRVRGNLESLPWVDRARIRRRWPATLDITVIEQVAAARWGDSGLLNTRGELFVKSARHLPAELPILMGPEGSQWQVAQRYLTLRGPLLRSGLQLRTVTLDSRGGWRLTLTHGIEIRLGRQAVDRRVARLLRVVTPLIIGRAEAVDYIDLRYANGFAIGWNAPAPGASPAEESSAGGANGGAESDA